jgi:hypothetical protein
MNYPNRIINIGEPDALFVKYIQNQLNKLGFGPLIEDGIFGTRTLQSVKEFQRQHVNESGVLSVEGKVDRITWETLSFNVLSMETISPLALATLKIALHEVGVKEVPPDSNRGPRVGEYLKSVRLSAGNPWCAAFIYWCFEQASAHLNRVNPLPRTGSCMSHWNNTKGEKISALQALKNPHLINPGDVFIISLKGGKGHTGIVYDIAGDEIITIEGNSNAFHSAEGGGVVQLHRKISSITAGFIRYC